MRHSPEAIHCARQDYAAGELTVAQICLKHGMSLRTLMRCVDGVPGNGVGQLEPIPRRRGGVARTKRRRRLEGDRTSIVRRMWRTAEAQVRDIEERLVQDSQPPDERERDARVLAVLVKTLRELAALDETQSDTAAIAERAGDNDEVPRDMDEFRRELARRMDAFVERRTGTRISDG